MSVVDHTCHMNPYVMVCKINFSMCVFVNCDIVTRYLTVALSVVGGITDDTSETADRRSKDKVSNKTYQQLDRLYLYSI